MSGTAAMTNRSRPPASHNQPIAMAVAALVVLVAASVCLAVAEGQGA